MTTATRYAENTSVSIAKSREEIERLLKRYKGTGFLYGEQGDRAMIAFELEGRRYRMELRYPPAHSMKLPGLNQYTKHRSDRELQEASLEKEKQRLWRGLALLVKGKLEAVASGIRTLEEELLSDMVLPNNETVGAWLAPQLKEVYQSGNMPAFLPGVNH